MILIIKTFHTDTYSHLPINASEDSDANAVAYYAPYGAYSNPMATHLYNSLLSTDSPADKWYICKEIIP